MTTILEETQTTDSSQPENVLDWLNPEISLDKVNGILSSSTVWQILWLKESSLTQESISSAIKKALKEYHPDMSNWDLSKTVKNAILIKLVEIRDENNITKSSTAKREEIENINQLQNKVVSIYSIFKNTHRNESHDDFNTAMKDLSVVESKCKDQLFTLDVRNNLTITKIMDEIIQIRIESIRSMFQSKTIYPHAKSDYYKSISYLKEIKDTYWIDSYTIIKEIIGKRLQVAYDEFMAIPPFLQTEGNFSNAIDEINEMSLSYWLDNAWKVKEIVNKRAAWIIEKYELKKWPNWILSVYWLLKTAKIKGEEKSALAKLVNLEERFKVDLKDFKNKI